ncbi:nuclear receptor-interacting protein 2 isoform X2 [Marmota flaviventris]|uniref:nuclear receptor-interacting protein 2 isoform X2 n=1 Tax=Marmota flaviventris TaxID=93162 RepID=UPI003A8C4E4A
MRKTPGGRDRKQSCGTEPTWASNDGSNRPLNSSTRTPLTCSPWTASRGSAPPRICQQPHNVIQRRLMEGNQSRLQGESPLVQALVHGQDSKRKTSGTEIPALLVNCKCQDQLLRVAVNTGTQHNQISTGCLSRLGLGKRVLKAPGGDMAPGPTQVEQLELQLGQEKVACSAQVVGKFSLCQQPFVTSPTFLFWAWQRQFQPLPVPKDALTVLSFVPVFSDLLLGWAGKEEVPRGRSSDHDAASHFSMVSADVDSPEFCLGLQTLLSLKCCIDLEHGVLRLKAPFSELPFLPLYQEPGQ